MCSDRKPGAPLCWDPVPYSFSVWLYHELQALPQLLSSSSVPYTRLSSCPCVEKAGHFSSLSTADAAHLYLAYMSKTSDPCFYFSGPEKQVSEQVTCEIVTSVYIQQSWISNIKTSGLIRLWASVDQASIWTMFLVRESHAGILVDEGPDSLYKSPKALELARLTPSLAGQCLVLNQQQVLQKDGNSWAYSTSDFSHGHACNFHWQWCWWQCPESIWGQQLPSQAVLKLWLGLWHQSFVFSKFLHVAWAWSPYIL